MPSVRSLRLNYAISNGSPNDILPFIHLNALGALFVIGPFHEYVTLVKHLIVPPRCDLDLECNDAHLGFDQRQLWAIIEKKIDSWAKNAPYRRLNAETCSGFVGIGNLTRGLDRWGSEKVDPILSISLYLSNFEETIPLFRSLFTLFGPTFYDTTCLHLLIDDGPFTSFRDDGSDSIQRVADFLQWRREQGFPVQKIAISGDWINRKYILTNIKNTDVEIDDLFLSG